MCLTLSFILTSSQTIYHVFFVFNYPSFSLCLKQSVIFTLSQTSYHIYFEINFLIHSVWSQPSSSICLQWLIKFCMSWIIHQTTWIRWLIWDTENMICTPFNLFCRETEWIMFLFYLPETRLMDELKTDKLAKLREKILKSGFAQTWLIISQVPSELSHWKRYHIHTLLLPSHLYERSCLSVVQLVGQWRKSRAIVAYVVNLQCLTFHH